MPAKFTIEPRSEYYTFIFRSESGAIILCSRLFKTRDLCRRAITQTIALVDRSDAFEKIQDAIGRYSFILRSKHDPCLGHSSIFYASSSRDFALRQLQHQAVNAHIEEMTPLYNNM